MTNMRSRPTPGRRSKVLRDWLSHHGVLRKASRLSSVVAPDPGRFGRLIVQRRRALGLTTRDVRNAGGPSTPTLSRLEAGKVDRPSRDTLAKLDVSLQWVPGSAARTFDGGLPETLEPAPPPTPTSEHPIVATPSGVMISTETLSALVELVDRIGLGAPTEAEAVDELGALVDRLLRAWIIVQAETWKAQNELQRNEILITRMLGDQLRREPDPETIPSDDLEDINYLRWLLGRRDDASAADRQRWLLRWEHSQR